MKSLAFSDLRRWHPAQVSAFEIGLVKNGKGDRVGQVATLSALSMVPQGTGWRRVVRL